MSFVLNVQCESDEETDFEINDVELWSSVMSNGWEKLLKGTLTIHMENYDDIQKKLLDEVTILEKIPNRHEKVLSIFALLDAKLYRIFTIVKDKLSN